MKQLVKLTLVSHLLCSTSLFAFNPVNGFYGGLFAGMSHGPSNATDYFGQGNTVYNGTISYSPYAGGGGFMLGYRFNQFRTEGQFLINRISTGPVTIGTCVIESHDIVTPTGVCPPVITANSIGYKGTSTAKYGLVNFMWDFFSMDGDGSLAPYVGLGVGLASVQNGNNYINTTTNYSVGDNLSRTGKALQGILGLNYYMDDFTWATMEFRYLNSSLKKETQTVLEQSFTIPSKSYVLSMLTFSINFAFDKGGIDS
jgi:opacity protein-like surface antigen